MLEPPHSWQRLLQLCSQMLDTPHCLNLLLLRLHCLNLPLLRLCSQMLPQDAVVLARAGPLALPAFASYAVVRALCAMFLHSWSFFWCFSFDIALRPESDKKRFSVH
jgi:hypothetical protein